MADEFTFDDLRSEPVPVKRLDAFSVQWQAQRRAALAERAAVLAAHTERERREAIRRNIAAARARVAALRATKAPAATATAGDERCLTIPLLDGVALEMELPPQEGRLVGFVPLLEHDATVIVLATLNGWTVWTHQGGAWVFNGDCGSDDDAEVLADRVAALLQATS